MGKKNKKTQQQTQAAPSPAAVTTNRNNHDTPKTLEHVLTTITLPVGFVSMSEHDATVRKLEKERSLLLEEYNRSLKQLSESKFQVEALQKENQQLKETVGKLARRVQELESQLRNKDIEIKKLTKVVDELVIDQNLRKKRLFLGEVGFSIERRLREKLSITESSCTIKNIRQMAESGALSAQELKGWTEFVNQTKWDSYCDTILCQLKELRLTDAHGDPEHLKKVSKDDLLDFADDNFEQDSDFKNVQRVIDILETLTPPSEPLLYRPSKPPRRGRATKQASTSVISS